MELERNSCDHHRPHYEDLKNANRVPLKRTNRMDQPKLRGSLMVTRKHRSGKKFPTFESETKLCRSKLSHSVRKYRLRVMLYLNINKTKSLRLLGISITHHYLQLWHVRCVLIGMLNRKEGDNVSGIYLVVVGHTLWYHRSTLVFWYHWLIPGMSGGGSLASRGFG